MLRMKLKILRGLNRTSHDSAVRPPLEHFQRQPNQQQQQREQEPPPRPRRPNQSRLAASSSDATPESAAAPLARGHCEQVLHVRRFARNHDA